MAAADTSSESATSAETQAPTRVPGHATAGKPAVVRPMPAAPTWPGAGNDDENYVPDEEFDYTDLTQVNRELNRCRSRLFRISRALKAAQREAAEADLTYRRNYRRALVAQSGGTAESRKAFAEMDCEGYENAVAVANQVADEWKKRATDARDDLKAVENLSHNVRAQMDIR